MGWVGEWGLLEVIQVKVRSSRVAVYSFLYVTVILVFRGTLTDWDKGRAWEVRLEWEGSGNIIMSEAEDGLQVA